MTAPVITLVSCPTPMDKRYGAGVKKVGNTMPNLGLAILAAILQRDGVGVRLVEVSAHGYDTPDLIRMVRDNGSTVVGVTVTTPNWHDVVALAEACKAALPQVKFIIGGPHIKAVQAEVLEQCAAIDAAVYGEAESIITPLVRTLANGGNLSGIANLIWRRGTEIVINPPAPLITDLDALPFPAWELIEQFPRAYQLTTNLHLRHPAGTLFTSRGCPFNCIYCDKSMFGNKVRLHSAEYVFRMMEKLHRAYGVRHIMFYDDTFTFDHQRVLDLCAMLEQARFDLTWACMSTVLVTREMLQAMHRAGCVSVAYGIESGSPRILKILNKPIDLDKTREVLRWTKEAGMRTRGFFIIANPGETLAEMQETVDYMLSADLDDAWLACFTPFPGSACYRDIDKWGTYERGYDKLTLYDMVFVPHGVKKEEIIALRDRAHRAFYFRLRIIWSYAKFFVRFPGYFWRVLKASAGILAVFRSARWEERLTPCDLPADRRN